MKNVLFSGFLAVILAVFSTVNLSAEESKTVSYKSSMHCNACKSTIMKTLKAENGVQDIEADVATNIVTVKYDPAKTDETKIADKIKKAGYKADVTDNSGKANSSSGCSGTKKKSSECGSVKSGAKSGCGSVKSECGSSKTKKTAA